MRRSFVSVLFFILVVVSQAGAQPNFRFFEPVDPPRKLQVVVPRGLALAAPENSRPALEMCGADFCEWAEIDVRLTKDGHHVVIHDDSVNRTTNGTGRVADLTLAELKNLDNGAWFARRFAGNQILTLAEVLNLAKGKINLCLACRQINPQRLVEEVTAAGMERQVIVQAEAVVLSRVRSLAKSALAVSVKYQPKSTPFADFVRDPVPAVAEIDADDVSADLCQQLHAAGIRVLANVTGAATDTPEVWNRVIAAGADRLKTDDPAGVLYLNARRNSGILPVKISAHRGANRYAPENTEASIREAARIGVDFAEIDIRTTKDGQYVLMHDGTVNRTTTGKGPVRQLTFAEATALSAGAWFGEPFVATRVPSFDDGLRALGEKLGVYLDAKDITPEALVAAIHRYHLEDRHVVYQSVAYSDQLRKLDPRVRALPPLRKLDQLETVAAVHPYGVDAEWTILSGEMIARCHERGIRVFSDALGRNEIISKYREAIGWGIDCIQTDHPLRVLRAIELSAVNGKKPTATPASAR